jgi:tetratricopeptide (TPR) repeat protein
MSEIQASYRLLEVSPDASPVEIRKAYLFLVNIWHPDRFVHEPAVQERVAEKLKEINEAYQRIKEAPLLGGVAAPRAGTRPNAPGAARIAGTTLTAPEWLARAKALTSKPIRLKPGEAIDWSNVENLNEHVEGIRAFREAVRIDPGYAEAWHGLALAHVQLGETTEAMKALDEVVRLEPDHPTAWVGLGAARAALGDFAAAARAFREAARVRPDASVFFSLGTAHAQLREADEARDAFREAVRLNPDLAEAWCSLGVECAFPGPDGRVEPEEALEAFSDAIRLKPDLSEAWCGKGTTLLGLQRHDEALAALREAVRLKPDFAEAWYSLAVAARYSTHKDARKLMREAYARLKLLNRDSASQFKELLPYHLRLSLLGAGLRATATGQS